MEVFVFEMLADRDLTPTEWGDAFAKRHLIAARIRAEQKERDRAEVSSDFNTPAERIRAWEKLCDLRLPSNPSHPVLEIVATSTHLTLAEVKEQQRARRTLG